MRWLIGCQACSLGIKDPEVAARAIVGGSHCPIDIGKIICTSNGAKREHFMINLCGFGLGVVGGRSRYTLKGQL